MWTGQGLKLVHFCEFQPL